MSANKDQDRTVGESPRFVDGKKLVLAGLREQVENLRAIPALWQRALAHKSSKRVGTVDYGASFHPGTDRFEYLAGFEISDVSGLPAGLSYVTIPAQRYAVFIHRGHVSELCQTCDSAGKWLEQSGHKHADAESDAPAFFERYSEDFNPQSGVGGMEVWVPIRA